MWLRRSEGGGPSSLAQLSRSSSVHMKVVPCTPYNILVPRLAAVEASLRSPCLDGINVSNAVSSSPVAYFARVVANSVAEGQKQV